MLRWQGVAVGLVLALTGAPAALAAPPANDDRADAQVLNLPAGVDGTLVDATVEKSEIGSECRRTDGSVWYRFTPPADRNVIVQFDAGGELDATVDVFQRTRSQLDSFDCDVSDSQGSATLELDGLDEDREVFIRIGNVRGGDPAGFDLDVLIARPPAEPPGKPLSPAGAKDSVDRLLNPSDAYSVDLVGGTTYRFAIKSKACVSLGIYEPHIKDFDSGPEQSERCGGYQLYTPKRSGRYILLAEAARGRGAQAYNLRAAPAGIDDAAPGRFILNDAKVTGHVNGGIDFVDLYRFDVTRKSELTLSIDGAPELRLLRDDGKRLDRGSRIETQLKPGRFYVAVQGEGKYTLRRVSRTITHSTLTFAGSTRAHVGPGTSVPLTLSVSPAVSGRGTILVERIDPLARRQFLRRYRVTVSGGRATVSFTPPKLGRYRATAVFKGTRTAGGSETGVAKLQVAGPLIE